MKPMTAVVDILKNTLKRQPILSKAGSMLRARLQENEALRARRRVERIAALRGVDTLSPQDTTRALRKRLAVRAQRNGWPRRKGDLHIFVAFRVRDWEQALFDAFKGFGDVTAFEWASQGFDRDAPDWLAHRSPMNRAMLAAFEDAHRRRPVDAFVGYVSGHDVLRTTLEQMAEAGAAIFNFSYDDKLDPETYLSDGTLRSPLALASVVDLNLTSDPGARLAYAIHGGLSRFHPECADPKVHRPRNLSFRYDVTFVGACYGFRPMFVENLRRLGMDVAAFGRGWPSGVLTLERMAEIYSESRINLGFGGIGHSRRLMCLKGRDFEVPMSGGLYLTQYNSDLEQVFDLGREIVTYTDEVDCAAKILALLADEKGASAIRRAGRARCLRDHTYEARWSSVFEAAGIMMPEQSRGDPDWNT
jgi:spore maturation protein CgeB